jgi:hypothetical protein
MSVIIHFFNGNDLEIDQHYFQKEYRDDIIIEKSKFFYEVYFFTKSSLEYEMRDGGYFASPGLIILEEISSEKIIFAIKELDLMGYFEWYKGSDSMSMDERFMKNLYLTNRDTFGLKPKSSLLIE